MCAAQQLRPRKRLMSRTFMTKVRSDMRVSSRKITRIVGHVHEKDEELVIEKATVFVHKINEKIETMNLYDPVVWNADQSGFEYEPIRNRTITYKGEKIVEARVTNKSGTTHSYTLQLHMSKAGKLGKRAMICFQEPKTKDHFGPLIQRNLDELLEVCSNIAVTCSSSGKFSKTLMRDWFDRVFSQDVHSESLLILDAWSGQGESAQLVLPDVSIEYIPDGATKYIQPLDVYFFRQYKILIKNVVEACRDAYFSEESKVRPSCRYFIVRLHSLCLNQVSHPRFFNMWRYAWQKPGYVVDESVDSFEDLSEILLKPLRQPDARCMTHDRLPLMRCVYCHDFICLSCFFDPIHLHL